MVDRFTAPGCVPVLVPVWRFSRAQCRERELYVIQSSASPAPMISDCFNAARWHLRAAFTARSEKCEGSGGGTVLLGSKVGEGSFSDVFAATERLPDGSTSRLAVKRVRLGGLPEADADACLLEATVMADLPPHPHLLATVGSVRRPSFVGPGEELLLLFELCPEGSLAEYLVGRRAWARPLDGDGVLAIFTQVCGGLAHLHAHGWAHCDVKPENLLLSATGWKLCDFGSVRDAPFRYVDGVTSPPELSEAEERIHRTSTPQYRPPEMYDLRAGEPVFTPADVWAVGVLLRSLFGTAGEERLGCLGYEPAKQLSGVVCADQVCTDKEALRPVHAWACADLSFEAHSLQSLELSFWRRRRWAPHSLVGRATEAPPADQPAAAEEEPSWATF
ncbi:hypothetical protein EMIHUDRAFT_223415 [Emiliania huxleyi CCMP1516]|uniref:non-specific serine/threonine protein kinase n=2 Tax=Emiliania huxleyi TaxID=2903 RepID=A0A0D3KVR9_EMIH1|nr:hypothetical protein EMIHUDRAFT_223415 [Emiliania huxleyi CCMP1516]EOD39854.1 hypothetical protein EMIHUDRAFT_223415 [Emiliania huxleyi CCMP1516]|eukprot:XP_005792283.1 hypothetical protein EMIHUDRAFT_223415 [Emiliania huxleyi CCMP1516]